MHLRKFVSFVLASVLISAHVAAAEAGAEFSRERRDESRASLFRADSQLSRAMTNSGPVDGFARAAAPEVTYLHPDAEILVGRPATHAFLRNEYANFNRDVRTQLHRIAGDVSADGTLGYTFGWLDENKSAKGSTLVDLSYGRYVAVWRRKDRDWEVEVFMRLSGTAPPAPAPSDALILDGEAGERVRNSPPAHALAAAVADARFADLSLAKGYSLAFDRYAHDAAILVTSGPIYWNRAGVNAAFGGWTPDQSLRWHPLRSGAAASGDLAWSVGHGNFHFNVGTANETRSPSKYITVWLNTPGGWKYLIDAGNARPADPAQ
jgi:ketosteroid isomerase-like protein